MARIHSFLRLVAEQQASDLHLHAGNPPVIRFQGDMLRLPCRARSETETQRLLLEILTDEQRDELKAESELCFLYPLEDAGRFRVSIFQQHHGYGAVFRVVPNRLPTLDELMLPASVHGFAELDGGLVLVTGPTGSGKSTTLAALVHEINRSSERHILTIEDPIEFVHRPERSLITQREVGRHTGSFAAAVRSAMREAPDVLVLGEMRDAETISAALSAAETGVLVLGTLHTSSAVKAIQRLIGAFSEDSLERARVVASVVLRGVIAQHLCKLASGDGRIAAVEVLHNTPAVANMIREDKLRQIDGYLDTAGQQRGGMQSLDQCVLRYVKEGLLTTDEGLKVANHPVRLRQLAAELPAEA